MTSSLRSEPVRRVLGELRRRSEAEDRTAVARRRAHEERLGRKIYGHERGAVYGLAPLSIIPEVGELLYMLALVLDGYRRRMHDPASGYTSVDVPLDAGVIVSAGI